MAATPEALLASFEEFIQSANRLECSHLQLQDEVVRLRRELEERNEALRRSLIETDSARNVLRQILESLPSGVLLLDVNRARPVLANPEAKRLLCAEFTEQSELPESLQRIVRESTPASNALDSEQHVCIESADGPRWLAVRVTHVSFSFRGPEKSHLLMTLQDVSAEKELEKQREQARNSLALAEMSSVLAHEIRNPLGAMELYLSLLRGQPSLDQEALEWTDRLTAGVRSLAATLDSVLRFYASNSLTLVPVCVNQVVEEGARFLEPVAANAGVSLRYTASQEALSIRGDSQALRQVILNLCGNALQHSHEGGVTSVSVQRAGSNVRVEVSDDGCGIASEHISQIFEAGFSADRRSSGLGLAVCKRIIEAHGGTIGVARTSKEGTTMFLEIAAV